MPILARIFNKFININRYPFQVAKSWIIESVCLILFASHGTVENQKPFSACCVECHRGYRDTSPICFAFSVCFIIQNRTRETIITAPIS